MILWHVESGRPTKLVPLIDMIWSPIFSFPDFSAGPPCIILAMITVGKMDPHPDSTITTPRISPFCFSMKTWMEENKNQKQFSVMKCSNTAKQPQLATLLPYPYSYNMNILKKSTLIKSI